jgi:hypothetical protein
MGRGETRGSQQRAMSTPSTHLYNRFRVRFRILRESRILSDRQKHQRFDREEMWQVIVRRPTFH